METLADRVEAAKQALAAAADPEAPWRCCHCGQDVDRPEHGWLTADWLRDQVDGFTGPECMIATTGLVRDGVFELDGRLRVRLAVSSGGGRAAR